jgi:hypothetical protein
MVTDLERKLEVRAGLADVAQEVTERVTAAWPEHAASLAVAPLLNGRISEHITAATRQLRKVS